MILSDLLFVPDAPCGRNHAVHDEISWNQIGQVVGLAVQGPNEAQARPDEYTGGAVKVIDPAGYGVLRGAHNLKKKIKNWIIC